MFEFRISNGGRTALPKAVRNALGLQAGDRVPYVVEEGEVRIIKLLPSSRLFGVLRHGGPTMALAEQGTRLHCGGIRNVIAWDTTGHVHYLVRHDERHMIWERTSDPYV